MGSTQTKAAAPRSKTNAIGASTAKQSTTTTTTSHKPDKHLKVVFTGAGGSGKTNLLYALKLGELPTNTIPTIGFNVEEIEINATKLTIWDVGGGTKISPLIYHYIARQNCHGVVFFIPLFWLNNKRDKNWLTQFNPSNIEKASHHDPEWVHQLRRHAIMRGVPLMILINEPNDNKSMELTQEDILKIFQLENIHERPTKVVTISNRMTPDDIAQMYKEMNWFYEMECKYASGDAWVSMPLSLFMPPIVRRTANVLQLVESFHGSNLVCGFVSSSGEWVMNQARDNYHMVCRDAGRTREGVFSSLHNKKQEEQEKANYNRHELSLEFQRRLSVDYPIGKSFDHTWYDNAPLGNGTHYDLLRMLYESVQRNGRKKALQHLFRDFENTTETSTSNSITTTATTVHWLPVTPTYFWLHMVDYYTQAVVQRLGKHQLSFRMLCTECPFLSHSVLMYDYYSIEKLKGGRKEMVLPDLKPLPSVLPKVTKFRHGEL